MPTIPGNNPITKRWRLVAHVYNRSTHLRVATGAPEFFKVDESSGC